MARIENMTREEKIAYVTSPEYQELMDRNDRRYGIPQGPSDLRDGESESENAARTLGTRPGFHTHLLVAGSGLTQYRNEDCPLCDSDLLEGPDGLWVHLLDVHRVPDSEISWVTDSRSALLELHSVIRQLRPGEVSESCDADLWTPESR